MTYDKKEQRSSSVDTRDLMQVTSDMAEVKVGVQNLKQSLGALQERVRRSENECVRLDGVVRYNTDDVKAVHTKLDGAGKSVCDICPHKEAISENRGIIDGLKEEVGTLAQAIAVLQTEVQSNVRLKHLMVGVLAASALTLGGLIWNAASTFTRFDEQRVKTVEIDKQVKKMSTSMNRFQRELDKVRRDKASTRSEPDKRPRTVGDFLLNMTDAQQARLRSLICETRRSKWGGR